MAFVRTVLRDVDAAELGPCYAHEHLVIDASYVTAREPDFRLDCVDAAAKELASFHAAGGRAAVDAMPCAAGRNALKLAEASRRSGVHIVCSTGLHLARYYPPGHWSERAGVDELGELFAADITEGIDANDCNGPTLRRTPHRAGVIKVAGGRDALNDRERCAFLAAAAAHRATGAPILTHAEEGTAALEQVELLASHGVDVRHVILSHTDRKPDATYHRAILRTGARVEYDSAFRWNAGEPNRTLDLLVALLPEFPEQIMLGMDAARRLYWSAYGGGPGLSFLLTTFTDRMRDAGIDAASIRRLFIDNPASAFSFLDRSPA